MYSLYSSNLVDYNNGPKNLPVTNYSNCYRMEFSADFIGEDNQTHSFVMGWKRQRDMGQNLVWVPEDQSNMPNIEQIRKADPKDIEIAIFCKWWNPVGYPTTSIPVN